jgi:hypothetical protein
VVAGLGGRRQQWLALLDHFALAAVLEVHEVSTVYSMALLIDCTLRYTRSVQCIVWHY